MVNTALRTLTFAHSPDPDDAYMFYGFSTGVVQIPGFQIRHHLEDIQTLNERAFRGEFEISAVSAHAFAYLTDRYWALSCGASVGRKYGPILVRPAQKEGSRRMSDIRQIAIPGKWTTAALVLDLWLGEQGFKPEKVIMPFDKILPAVATGQVDAGVIIHEGQLTYERHGTEKVWDAGQWWTAKTDLPLPLGLDVVRKDLGEALAAQISSALRQSIQYAHTHPDDAMAYALQYGRGLDLSLGKRFVGMYVNEDTLHQGHQVQRGLRRLYKEAFRKGLLPARPDIFFV